MPAILRNSLPNDNALIVIIRPYAGNEANAGWGGSDRPPWPGWSGRRPATLCPLTVLEVYAIKPIDCRARQGRDHDVEARVVCWLHDLRRYAAQAKRPTTMIKNMMLVIIDVSCQLCTLHLFIAAAGNVW